MSLRTPLCDLLGIDVPILNVGFAASAVPELAAAVSNAGGLGVIGLGFPVEEIKRRVGRTRELTSRPFGGNIIIAAFASPHVGDDVRELRRGQIAAALVERVPVLVLFWGDPAPFIEPAHKAGAKVLIQVGSVDEAAAAASAGVDAVIMQGSEAGGHVKATRSLWETLPAAVEATKPVPVIASGGIGDGRGIARAMGMGAQGVSLGTRFVASEEAWVHDYYKRRVVAASAADTFYSPDLYDVGWKDAPHRTIKNKTYARWDAAGRPAWASDRGKGRSSVRSGFRGPTSPGSATRSACLCRHSTVILRMRPCGRDCRSIASTMCDPRVRSSATSFVRPRRLWRASRKHRAQPRLSRIHDAIVSVIFARGPAGAKSWSPPSMVTILFGTRACDSTAA